MMLSRCVVTAAVLAAGLRAARANGVMSEEPAGGHRVPARPTRLRSRAKSCFSRWIRCASATSTSRRHRSPQNVTISFPMPEVEIDDSPLGGLLFGTQQKGDLRNYMKFAVTVDGKPGRAAAARGRAAARQGRDGAAEGGRHSAGLPRQGPGGDAARAQAGEGCADQGGAVRVSPMIPSRARIRRAGSTRWCTNGSSAFRPVRPGSMSATGRSPGTDRISVISTPGPRRRSAIASPTSFRNALKRRRAAGRLGDRLTLGDVTEDRAVLERADRPLPPRGGQGQGGEHGGVLSGERDEDLRRAGSKWTATNSTPERDIEVVFFTARGAEQ